MNTALYPRKESQKGRLVTQVGMVVPRGFFT
jgi:hypothetical protein